VLQILPEVLFTLNTFLIFVEPPFKTVPLSLFDVASLRQVNASCAPVIFGMPEIEAGSVFHRVSADEFSIVGPTALQSRGPRRCGKARRKLRPHRQCHRVFRAFAILHRALEGEKAILVELPHPDDFSHSGDTPFCISESYSGE